MCVLPTVCGNGVLQAGEECECASGTKCRFCADCKLQNDKECTPDSFFPCCDDEGKFSTTRSTCTTRAGVPGYCKVGECVSVDCVFNLNIGTRIVNVDQFCGTSQNTCKAKCGVSTSTDLCYDTVGLKSGGRNLEDGAICMKGDLRGICRSGSCESKPSCGNGVLQVGEACECASGTSCR